MRKLIMHKLATLRINLRQFLHNPLISTARLFKLTLGLHFVNN